MLNRHFARSVFLAMCCTVLIAVSALAQTPTTIYTFPGGNGNPANPQNNIVAQGRDGDFIFTTCIPLSVGSEMFDINESGTLTTIYTPSNCSYGVSAGTDGNFYSTTGNNDGAGGLYGTVYKVTPTGTATTLHTFTNGADGSYPYWPPIEGTNGTFYGTTQAQVTNSTAYSVTSSGTFTTLHTFTGSDGQNVNGLVQGSDGNFYGSSQSGGTSNDGVIFKMTPTGTVTVLHNFAGSDGAVGRWNLIQAKDGNFYGVTLSGGTNNAGVLFKITSTGTYTVLYNFPLTGNSATGNFPFSSLMQATNGLLYGVTGNEQGPWGWGTIYSYNTTNATFTSLYTFTGGTAGGQPIGPLLQNTNGLLYGTTFVGGNVSGSGYCTTVEYDGELVGVGGCGTVFTLNIGAKPFINLSSTSGKVASQVGIFGQGFSSSSVVKFNGVQATKITLSGTTFITATVPTGATSGYVTVTTGSTTLTSTAKYTVHNSWASGAAMPTATVYSSAAVLGGQIYVIGGDNASGTVLTDVQIYNPTTNKWSTGTALPTATDATSAAVVNNVLYVFGGSTSSGVTGAVWAYSTKTNEWTSMAPMPTPRNGTLAVVEKNIVYVMGGNLGGGANFVATVESYNPATNTWTEETSMDGAKDYAAGGLIGTTIVAGDGAVASGQITGDIEGYNATTNAWTEETADPTARTGTCYGVISSVLYDASGYNNSNATTVNESYSLSTNKWTTTLLSIPQGTMFAAPAVDNGQLYCIGGTAAINGTAISNVQIYQP